MCLYSNTTNRLYSTTTTTTTTNTNCYYIESKRQKYQSFQRRLQKEASFDDNDARLSLDCSIDDDRHKIGTTPGFIIKTNMDISPTECNCDDNDNIMEVCSVHSNISFESNMGECDIKIDNNGSYKFVIDKDNVIKISNEYPEVLIGWRVNVPQYGMGVILDVVKRKMRSTKYKIEFDVPICPKGTPKKKSTYELLLHRSDKKKGLPFTVIKKVA